MRIHLTFLGVVGVVALGVAAGLGIRVDSARSHRRTPSPVVVAHSSDVHQVAAANTVFAFKLLSRLTAEKPGQNVFISPYSISNALTMTLNGAGGETETGIAKTLGLDGVPIDRVNGGNALLLPSLENPDPKVDLSVANALWANTGTTFAPAFKQICRNNYDADVITLDLSGPAGAPTINHWVSDNTQGKIDTIVSPDDLAGATAVLTNAVYFHGKWTDPFDKSDTQYGPFKHGNRTPTTLSLMSKEADVPYLETRAFQAVSLPYGDGRMSLCIVLPKSGVRLNKVVGSLNAYTWGTTVEAMKQQDLTIVLPRFKVDYAAALNRPLIDLGMSSAFNPGADFRPMGLGGSAISAVLHKAVIEVDEEGTTAAAATAVVMTAEARMPPKTVVRVDHPFFCAIRDNLTGTILFAGVIYDPQRN